VTPRPSAAPKIDTGPRIRTQAEMEKPRSPFLVHPSFSGAAADRYNPGGPDWSEIPPWRQTSFFGIRAPGRFFIYVIDCSGSMIDDDRLTRATIEVRRSVLALQSPQQFEVIFFNHESIPMPGGPRPRSADSQAKSQLLAWLHLIEPDGGTDPRLALRQALSLRPEAVFLLSDGEFPEGTVAEVARLNTRKIPIHCVDLAGGLAGDHLKRIAQASGGQYASRPGSLQGRP
jgi:Mg-chelatase subunit ChlD